MGRWILRRRWRRRWRICCSQWSGCWYTGWCWIRLRISTVWRTGRHRRTVWRTRSCIQPQACDQTCSQEFKVSVKWSASVHEKKRMCVRVMGKRKQRANNRRKKCHPKCCHFHPSCYSMHVCFFRLSFLNPLFLLWFPPLELCVSLSSLSLNPNVASRSTDTLTCVCCVLVWASCLQHFILTHHILRSSLSCSR